MELDEVVRRVLGQHWRLIGALLITGMVVGFATHVGDATTYTASTRLSLDTKDPESQSEAESIADTADAIASSPARVASALLEVGLTGRDALEIAEERVSVEGLGSSGVVELSVTEANPRAAAALADSLAREVIRARLAVTGDQLGKAVGDLNQRIGTLNRTIARLGRAEPADKQATAARESLIQERASMESARVSALSADSERATASIISPAALPARADRSSLVPDVGLGALLGLVLGVGLAALIETLRPTLVGRAAVAREFDTPVLGGVADTGRGAHQLETTSDLGARLGMAAASSGVGAIDLLPASPAVRVDAVARSVDAPLQVKPFDATAPGGRENGSRRGLVLVSPTRLARGEVDRVTDLLRISPGPLLGLVAYESGKEAARAESKGAGGASPGGKSPTVRRDRSSAPS